MTDYTKTTNFASKDSLPSGNANKIVKGTEIDTEFNNIATASATKANIASPTFTGTVTIPTADINGGAVDGTTIGASSASSIVGTTIVANTSINIAGDGATVTGIKDEDDMSSNSATKLATQQSIKAYVDSQVTAQDLDVTDGSSSIDIDLDSESLGILGGTGIDSTASGTGVTLAIDSTVATLTGSQTLTNKTLTAPTLTGTAVVASLDISGDVDVDGTLETDALSINGTTVTSTAAELNILDGVTSTAAELNILDGVTSTTAELNILDGVTSTAAELNILDGKAFLDEDDMSSNSATGIASQQSIKAYVDSQVTAQDLDFQADSGGALSIDLDSETLTFTGGTGIDTSGSGNAVTFAIDSTVATLTGSQTLTNKTLTSPDINTPDIDGGTIDGTTIGGSTAAAGTFTTITVDTDTLVTDATNNRVGVGVSDPAYKLQVQDTTAASTSNYVSVVSGNQGNAGIIFGDSDSDTRGGVLYNNADDALRFFKSGFSEAGRFGSGGNFGVGTTETTGFSYHTNIFLGGTGNIYSDSAASADASLSISQNAFVDADGSWETRVTDEASNYYQNAGTHGFRVASSTSAGTDITWRTAFLIKNNGSLTMNGQAGSSPIFEMINNDNEDNDTGRESSVRFSGHRSGGEDVINAQISAHHDGSSDDDKGMLFFYTNNGSGLNLAQKIDSSGRVGINETNPEGLLHIKKGNSGTSYSADGADQLILENSDSMFMDIRTPHANSGGIMFSNATDGRARGIIQYAHSNDTMYFNTGGANRMYIAGGGQLFLLTQTSGAGNATLKYTTGTGAVTFDTSSRLVKEDIEDIPYGLSAVMSLSPKKYRRTDSEDKDEVGFIADEMLEVVPEVVGMMNKSVFTGVEQDTEEVAGSVEYEKLTAVLTKAIQEQQTLIESLTDRIAALEND